MRKNQSVANFHAGKGRDFEPVEGVDFIVGTGGQRIPVRDVRVEAAQIANKIQVAGGRATPAGDTIFKAVNQSSDFKKYPNELREVVDNRSMQATLRDLNKDSKSN